MKFRIALIALSTSLLLAICPAALATNALTPPGAGVAQVSIAGAGTAMTHDASALIRNPAGGLQLDNMLSVNAALAKATASYRATSAGGDYGIFEIEAGSAETVNDLFLAPSLSYSQAIHKHWSVGLQISGAGLGSKITQGSSILGRGFFDFESHCQGSFAGGGASSANNGSQLCGQDESIAGVALTQVFTALNISYQPFDNLSIGLAPMIAAQQFEARGLSAFKPYSLQPDALSDNGNDYSEGFGYRLGLLWQIDPAVRLGIAYQSATKQSSLKRYRGLFHRGRVDTAPHIHLGLELELQPQHQLYLDGEYVQFSKVAAFHRSANLTTFAEQCVVPRLLANGFPLPNSIDGLPNLPVTGGEENSATCFAGSEGVGLGWQDTLIYKIGYRWANETWSFGLGYSRGGNPVESDSGVLAALVPGIADRHIATGVTWRYSPQLELGLGLSYSLPHRHKGGNELSHVGFEVNPNQQEINVDAGHDVQDQQIESRMEIWQLELSVNWRLGD